MTPDKDDLREVLELILAELRAIRQDHKPAWYTPLVARDPREAFKPKAAPARDVVMRYGVGVSSLSGRGAESELMRPIPTPDEGDE